MTEWMLSDADRLSALTAVSRLNLPDSCIAAGFVRNLAWDNLHSKHYPTPLNDLDVIYFDPTDISEQRDIDLETQLKNKMNWPWSVKNQARMHFRNNDQPYQSTIDAMSYWPELETAVGVRLVGELNDLEFISPFGLSHLFNSTITMNPKRPKPEQFHLRVKNKKWLKQWPNLNLIETFREH